MFLAILLLFLPSRASVFVHNADAKADSKSSQHAAYSCTCGCYLGIHKLRLAVCFQRVSSAIGCRAPSNKSPPSACSDSLECGPASHENTHFSREKGAPAAQKNQICLCLPLFWAQTIMWFGVQEASPPSACSGSFERSLASHESIIFLRGKRQPVQ